MSWAELAHMEHDAPGDNIVLHLTSEKPIVIAHRGFSDEAPENTMAAFHKAISAKAHMIEFDVRLSSDDEFVIFHDKKLERTSEGRGLVKKHAAEELVRIDNGSWFSSRFSRERIPRLRDVLALTKHNVALNIEIKPDVESSNGTPVEEMLVETLAKARVLHRTMITSFNHKMIKRVKHLRHEIAAGIIYNPIANFRRSPSQLAAAAHAEFFICSKYQVNHDVVNDVHENGLKIFVYGISSERDTGRMLRLGVDGIISNNPALVGRAIEVYRR
jgi:glycerophosphoryl diester phosphodiesterase